MDVVTEAPIATNGDLVDPRWRVLSAPVIGWALYDFANTIFSFSVITTYLNSWLITQHHRPDWNIGLMSFVVGLVLVVAMPMMGALSDRLGRRMPFLALWTTTCVVLTAVLGGVNSTTVALIVGGLAIFAFQLSLAMYDPLLANVAPPARRGTVSGVGIGTGYLGTLFALPILTVIVGTGKHIDRQDAFVPTAIMFAVFALPIFLFVRDRATWRAPVATAAGTAPAAIVVGTPAATDGPGIGAAMVDALGQVVRTVRLVRSDFRDVGRFLIARFLYVDAIATVIAFLSVFLDRLDFTNAQKNALLFLSTIAAVIGAFVAGRLVERHGPKAVLQRILLVAIAVLLVAAAAGSATLMWFVGPLVGITLGCVWTSDRVFMLHLSPPAERGEFFGIYNLVGKLSSGFGPLVLWGGTIWLLHTKLDAVGLLGASRAALAVLAVAIFAGWLVLRPLADHDRYPGQADPTGA
jgi:UMF1 family MFS transporter